MTMGGMLRVVKQDLRNGQGFFKAGLAFVKMLGPVPLDQCLETRP